MTQTKAVLRQFTCVELDRLAYITRLGERPRRSSERPSASSRGPSSPALKALGSGSGSDASGLTLTIDLGRRPDAAEMGNSEYYCQTDLAVSVTFQFCTSAAGGDAGGCGGSWLPVGAALLLRSRWAR